ncbi:MAG: toxin-activating lysine-acyltransferase [Alphaproteobacteria bacterium]|nr:toxin-activating lysine-acyltransferase [Alphaproteobacteria bacterium]
MSDILFGTDGTDADARLGPPSAAPEPAAAPAPDDGAREVPRDDLTRLLGQVVSLLGQSPAHRHLFVGDLEWLVLPALLNRQARIWRRETERGAVPVVYASWALVNAEVEARLTQGQNRLKPTEWRSGDIPWLIDLVAPYGGGDNALKELADQVFPGRLLKAIVPAPTGGFAVREIRGSDASSQEAAANPAG